MYAFILEAKTKKLGEMFDRYLNAPSRGAVSVKPAGSLIVLNFTSLAQVSADKGPDRHLGYFKEAEVAIWTLGFDSCREEFVTFVPYMIVDQGSAMAMGREVFGFPKQLGTVRIPEEDWPSRFEVSVPGVKKWAKQALFEQHQLIEIRRTGPDRATDRVTFDSQFGLVTGLAAIVREDKGLLAGFTGDGSSESLVAEEKLFEMLFSESLPMLFLKQIRDGEAPGLACYQAIQLANFTVTGFYGAGVLPGTWAVSLNNLANEPIRRELGLKEGVLTPLAAFWVDFDFDLSVTEKLWTNRAQSISVTVGRGG
jgi:hypothetical protein